MKILQLVILWIIGFSLLLVTHERAYAVSVSYETISGSLGTKYNFTLKNDDIAPNIFELFIHAPTDSLHLLSFASPAGWGDGFGGSEPNHGDDLPAGTAFVEWFADFGKELPKGSSLSDFSFISKSRISKPITFSVNQDNSAFFTARQSNFTVTPVPLSSILFLTGAIPLAARLHRKRSKRYIS